MNYSTIEASELETILILPEHLRSEQCYNDIQHSMLVILFRHAMKAIRSGNVKYTDLLMDNITIYLYIHFLAEEEGMVYSTAKGIYDRNRVSGHAQKHLAFLDHWMQKIYKPHKDASSTWSERYSLLEDYYARLIEHIDHEDQNTYGAKLEAADKNHRAESAFVARSNIPLSPLMRGAVETVRHLNPEAARLLNAEQMNDLAFEPLGDVTLMDLDEPLNASGRPSLRDRFYASVTSHAPTLRMAV